MASADEHAQTVLSAILQGRRDLLERASQSLTPEHFSDRIQARLFSMLLRYSDYTSGAVMPLKYLDDNLRGRVDPGQSQLFTETYQLLQTHKPDDAEFAWSVQQLREIAAERSTGEALTEAMEILRRGKTVGSETVQGHHAARSRLLESFQEIDRNLIRVEAPEGDIRDEASDMLADYVTRKHDRERGVGQGVRFGIDALDRKLGGLQPGELGLLAGYSSDGKSSLCVQLSWSAAVEQGKNVVFLTTETLRPQIRRKLIARHSKSPMFELPEGLNTKDLKAGTLSETDEVALQRVIDDLTKNPSYGRTYIAQVPRAAGLGSVEQRLHRIQRKFNIDLVVMDYLALLVSERRRQTAREEYAAILKEAKLLAVAFDNGRGVPFVSPWQVSRAAREAAENLGQYTSAAMSETAEATNSSDVIISLLAPSDNTERYADTVFQILKSRDGETANGIIVEVDYATSHFRSKRLVVDEITRGGSGALTGGDFSLDSYLNVN